jgi:hypothetical protein
VISLPDLREAWDDGFQAIVAIETGHKDHARLYLGRALIPASRAFPSGSREGHALTLVLGALLEEAA